MNDMENKNENLDLADDADLRVNTSEREVDVDEYIKVSKDEDENLELFRQSERKPFYGTDTSRLNKNASGMSDKLPSFVKKKDFAKKSKRKDSKVKIIFIAVTSFLLITGIGIATAISIVNVKKNTIDASFRYSMQDKEVGTVKSLIKRNVRYAYGVYYPFFDKHVIDNYISDQTDDIIDTFVSKYKRYNSSEKGTGVVMFSDYSSIDFVDYYQIIRTTQYKFPDGKTIDHICTAFYDVKNDKILSASDIFDSTFKQIISVKIANYLKENTTMSNDEISSLTNYKKMKIGNFSIDAEEFSVYYDYGDEGTVTVSFPLDSIITGHFKAEFKSLPEDYSLAHKYVVTQTDTQ